MTSLVLLAAVLSQSIASRGITNAASYTSGFVSPGELISIFGENLGPSTLVPFQVDSSGKIGRALAGVTVSIDGLAAPLLFVSSSQIGAVVPFGISSSAPRVSVTYNGVSSPAVTVIFADAEPALFSLNSSGTGPAAALNQDGSLNSDLNPASKGSVISLYGTGQGNTTPGGIDGQISSGINARPVLPVSATVGGFPATVLYAAAAPNLVSGMFQINLRIPSESSSGPSVPVVIKVGPKSSPKGVTIAVQ